MSAIVEYIELSYTSTNHPMPPPDEEEGSFYDGSGTVLLRRPMNEQLRSKLEQRVVAAHGRFIQIASVTQADSGKLDGVVCFISAENEDADPYRISIRCQGNRFLVFQDDDLVHSGIHSSLSQTPFQSWLDVVSAFGASGRCSSLSALFDFAHSAWLRFIRPSGSAQPAFAIDSLRSAVDKAHVEICSGRPYRAIDLLSQALSLCDCEGREYREAVAARAAAYLNAGLFPLAIQDCDMILRSPGVSASSLNPFTTSSSSSSSQYTVQEPIAQAELLWIRGMALEGLLRPREALDDYVLALEYDSGNLKAQERFSLLFELLANASPSHSPGNSRRRSRVDSRVESIPESVNSGTTASRRSSRSTNPTNSSSDVPNSP